MARSTFVTAGLVGRIRHPLAVGRHAAAVLRRAGKSTSGVTAARRHVEQGDPGVRFPVSVRKRSCVPPAFQPSPARCRLGARRLPCRPRVAIDRVTSIAGHDEHEVFAVWSPHRGPVLGPTTSGSGRRPAISENSAVQRRAPSGPASRVSNGTACRRVKRAVHRRTVGAGPAPFLAAHVNQRQLEARGHLATRTAATQREASVSANTKQPRTMRPVISFKIADTSVFYLVVRLRRLSSASWAGKTETGI